MPHTFEPIECPSGSLVAGAGSPVVLLHSSLASKSQWAALSKRLATRFRVIALDLHGYGDNPLPAPRPVFTLDDEVRLVTSRLDRLLDPAQRVHLVGHSYGALVALRFAQLQADRVATMSLYEPVAFRMLDDDDAALQSLRRMTEDIARLVAGGRNQDAAQTFVDFWSGDGYFASLTLPTRYAIARRVAKVPLDFQASMRWPAKSSDLRAIGAPTLLLVGDDSPTVTRRIGERLAAALGNCRMRECGAGHMGPITDPTRINPWIEAFFDTGDVEDPVPAAARGARAPLETNGTTTARW